MGMRIKSSAKRSAVRLRVLNFISSADTIMYSGIVKNNSKIVDEAPRMKASELVLMFAVVCWILDAAFRDINSAVVLEFLK